MKFLKLTFLSHKSKTYAIFFFLLCGVLLNSYAGFSYSKMLVLFSNPIATISSSSSEICENEIAIITFEGSEGAPNYIFTYTINAGSEQTISTTGSENAVSLNFSTTSSGTYTYTLVKVEDSDGAIEDVDEEIVITVTSPPSISFTLYF